ncbi:MAG: hypothetical protein NTY83_02675 [Candidatus Micrarchaeota archaeon]|nr:hypothetical protein [Candidatus Micrarchaeota archaeon]
MAEFRRILPVISAEIRMPVAGCHREQGAGNRRQKTARGQAFTVDALLSVFVVIFFMVMVLNFSLAGRHVTSSIQDEKMAEDILVSLAHEGGLAVNSTILNRSLYAMAGKDRKYKAEISWYEYMGGAYTLSTRETIGTEPGEDSEVSVSERSIENYEGLSGSRLTNMTQVRLYIWR